MPWLGLLLLLPVFLILAVLGVLTRRGNRRWGMLLMSLLALGSAVVGCAFGLLLPGRGQHQLFPQIAAATLSFVSFVGVWSLGLLLTRGK